MRAKLYLVVSLVLNFAFAIALYVVARTVTAERALNPPRRPALITTNPTIRIAKTNVVFNPRMFSWRDIEAPEYADYIFNLRSIGCPDSTIRDIIVADVDQLYARKGRAMQATNDVPWWRSEPDPRLVAEQVRAAQDLEDERRELLTRLLGSNWDQSAAPPPVPLTGPILGSLPPDVQQKVQEIQTRSMEAIRAYTREQEEQGQPVSEAEVARLREETRAELAKVLNAEQLEEFLLRYSPTANRLRESLRGFNATPDEFRAIFRATDAIERQLATLAGSDDPGTVKRRQELEAQRQTAIRNALPNERYQAYRIVQDPAYREAVELAQKEGAPPRAAMTLYELTQATTQEKQRIALDPRLTEDQKASQLKDVDRQLERARDQVLGKEPPPEQPEANGAPDRRTHVMAPFETLAHLSLLYSVRMTDIRAANPGIDFGRILPGQPINIPPPISRDDPAKWVPFRGPRGQ